MLFLLVINFIGRHSIDRLHWTGGNLSSLDFADDIVVFGPTHFALQDLTTTLENQAASTRLRINGQKTKVVCNGYTNTRVLITISGQLVVVNFTYLGSFISSDGDAE